MTPRASHSTTVDDAEVAQFARLAESFGPHSLFDLTRKRHGLDAAVRRLLTLGALVHDVGRAIEDKGHALHGARCRPLDVDAFIQHHLRCFLSGWASPASP